MFFAINAVSVIYFSVAHAYYLNKILKISSLYQWIKKVYTNGLGRIEMAKCLVAFINSIGRIPITIPILLYYILSFVTLGQNKAIVVHTPVIPVNTFFLDPQKVHLVVAHMLLYVTFEPLHDIPTFRFLLSLYTIMHNKMLIIYH